MLNGQAKDEVSLRIDSARRAFLHLWARSEINLQTEIRVFHAAVPPVPTYGCETRLLWVGDTRTLEVFDHWYLRLIFRTSWEKRTSNNEIRRQCCDSEQLSTFLQHRRLQWFGDFLQYSDTNLSINISCTLFGMTLLPWQSANGCHWRGQCLGSRSTYGHRY